MKEDIIITLLLRGVIDEYVDVLNLMGFRDVSQLPLADIYNFCRKYSWSRSKLGKVFRDSISRVSRLASRGVTRDKIENLLEFFKIDLLDTVSSQLDTLKIKIKKKEEENVVLSILCSRCKKTILWENVPWIIFKCVHFAYNNILRSNVHHYLAAQNNPQKPQATPSNPNSQYSIQFIAHYANNAQSWHILALWYPTQNPNHPCQQAWRGTNPRNALF